MDYLVPTEILRHESEYKISATLTNEELTFVQRADQSFIPSKCKWLEVVGHGVNEGYKVLQVSPGTEDITFQLTLKRNPALDCSQFNFFDAFNGIDFSFLMTDTVDYISYAPQMDVIAYDGETDAVYQLGDIAPATMVFNVTLPLQE